MLDHLIIGTYLALLLFVGLYNRSGAQSIRNYGKIDAKIQNKTLFLLATIFTNSVGGGTVFGLSERVYSQNLSYVYAIALTIIMDILVAIFLVPKLAKHYGVISIGEIMGKYYGKLGRVMIGGAATLVSFGCIAVQISVSSRILQHVLHINYIEGVILSYIIVVTYTAIGGLRSVIFTNFAQFLAIVIFIPIISIVGLSKLGVMNFIQSAPMMKYSISYLWQDVGLLFLSFSFIGIYPGFIQRSFMTENYKATQQAIFKKSIIYLLFLVFIGINGLLSYMHYSGNDNSLALLSLIDALIPPGLRGLVIVGLLAAVMSTADSELNIASISLTNDVFQPLFQLHDSKMVLLFTQTSAIIIGSFAIYLALQFDNTVALLFFIAGFWLPFMLVPFLACLYGITINKWAMVFCSSVGVGVFTFWQINYANQMLIKSAFVGLVANFICFMLFRLFWPKEQH